ncbi:MAG: hypothetical protein QOG43_3466 [Actinomycetota bacterium]|nr:hypothetical protein [Actinomycetota bacterium]
MTGVVKRVLLASVILLVAFGVTFALTRDGDDAGGKGGGPTTVVRRDGAAVTEADNGGEVTVPPNQPFVLHLKGSADAPWGLPRAQADTLALVGSSQELDGSLTATFLPLETTPGVVVSAPRSGAITEGFQVTIRVEG